MEILGIDDATRAPVLGSLYCAGFKVNKKQFKHLKRIGVKDSKLLTHVKIEKIYPVLKKLGKIHVERIEPEMISRSKFLNQNLNDLECIAYCKIAQILPADKVIINNFDISRDKFIERAERLGFFFDWKKWRFGHNNESRYLPVGAASIVAKHFSIVEYSLHKELFKFDFGSGNPNDRRTIQFLKIHSQHAPMCEWGCKFIRWNWKTLERVRLCEEGTF
jgi:ribonuclease HII